MAFEWLRFLEQHNIEFKTSGANVARGHVAVHCPFCAASDPSQHMSINLEGKGWRCWRNADHKGRNPMRLVQALVGCTMERALEIVGQTTYMPDNFLERVKSEIEFKKLHLQEWPSYKLTLPHEFNSFEKELPSSRPFFTYLENRGFTRAQIKTMSSWYDVHYCTRGPFAGRIIFAVYRGDVLVSWTGRAISRNEPLRYKALTTDLERAKKEGLKPALNPISHNLLWYDDLMKSKSDTLLLVEGPFDALKVNVLGKSYGISATCFFTSAPTDAQIDLLHTLRKRFKHCVLLLDRNTFAITIRTTNRLSTLGIVVEQLPNTISDPGEFGRTTFDNFVLALERRLA